MSSERQPTHQPRYAPPPPRPRKPGARLVELIYLISGIIQAVIIIGFAFRLVDALTGAVNESHWLISPLYSISELFVAPFRMTNPVALSPGVLMDLNPLIAIVAYILLTALLVKTTEWMFGLFARRRQA